jgi:simple sugar transport system permease protein
MSQTLDRADATASGDERAGTRSLGRRLLSRPEIGSAVGAVAIFVFFLIVAPTFRTVPAQMTVLYSASTIGIMAVGVALLMIGGEFDLSAGVGVISSALMASMFAYQLNAHVWVGVLVALAFSLAIGFFNGWMVMTTGIPSFLVTLGTFLMLRGANIALTKIVTGGVASPPISDMQGFSSARALFSSEFVIAGQTLRITVVYWLLLVAIATWVLLRSRVGNWIFAVGGNKASARAVGVPVKRVKIGLFMFLGFCAWLLGMHQLFAFNTIQSGGGIGEEFIYIIAAVIGGTLLTGGYGSAVGAAIGAYIFGMARQSIVYAGWDANWYFFFLGLMLLLATVANNWVRQYATRG